MDIELAGNFKLRKKIKREYITITETIFSLFPSLPLQQNTSLAID